MNSCDGSCNSVEDPFDRICVHNKIEDMNLELFKMIKEIWINVFVTFDQIENTPESAVINPSNRINYWLITVVLLWMACLLLLVSAVGEYHMKHGLTISCLLSYYYRDE